MARTGLEIKKIITFFAFLNLSYQPLYASEDLAGIWPQISFVFKDAPLENMEISVLPSFTNKNYLIQYQDIKAVLRTPGIGTERYINRNIEYINAQLAFDIKVNPAKILFFDPLSGVQITQFVPYQHQLDYKEFYEKSTLREVINCLKQIHQSDLPFNNQLNPFERTRKIIRWLNELSFSLSSEHLKIQKMIDQIEPLLSSEYFERLPCHNDPVPSNFLRVDGKLTMLDWEYAGLNDPAYELSLISCVMNYSEELDHYMIDCYNPADHALLYYRLVIFKPVIEFWLTCWASSQILLGQSSFSGFSLEQFANDRLLKCQNHLTSPIFKQATAHLKSLLDQNR